MCHFCSDKLIYVQFIAILFSFITYQHKINIYYNAVWKIALKKVKCLKIYIAMNNTFGSYTLFRIYQISKSYFERSDDVLGADVLPCDHHSHRDLGPFHHQPTRTLMLQFAAGAAEIVCIATPRCTHAPPPLLRCAVPRARRMPPSMTMGWRASRALQLRRKIRRRSSPRMTMT